MTTVSRVDLSTPESTADAGAQFGFGYARTVRAMTDQRERDAAVRFLEDVRLPEWRTKLRQAGASDQKIGVFIAGIRAGFDTGIAGFGEATLTIKLSEIGRA